MDILYYHQGIFPDIDYAFDIKTDSIGFKFVLYDKIIHMEYIKRNMEYS